MPTEIKKEYLHLFETQSAHDAARTRSSESYFEPWTAYTVENKSVSYNLPPCGSACEYLTFEALESGTFTMTLDAKLPTTCVEYVSYSLDNGETWTTTNNVDNQVVTVTTPTVAQGEKVLWKGEGVQYCTNTDAYPGSNIGYGYFTSTGEFDASGNMMSMLYGDDFIGEETFPTPITTGYGAGGFGYVFGRGNCGIVSADNLLLPATTLANGCYNAMFYGCTSLTTAPALPATTLAERCYSNMFYGCTALTTAPVLPATAMAQACYSFMFSGCTALTTAPALPAETMASTCYQGMFNGCTMLTTAPTLPATTLAVSCYATMFQNCYFLRTAPALPATTLANSCYKNMFYGCNHLTTAPVLPSETMVLSCYNAMFYGCTALTTPPALPATTLANGCYSSMFSGCNHLTTAPTLPATTLEQNCYNSMFDGCTALTTAPELPATTLVSNCYNQMFIRCSNLNHIKAMFTTEPSTTYTNNWVYGVAASGTFVKNSAAQWSETGVNGVPSGWTVETASE